MGEELAAARPTRIPITTFQLLLQASFPSQSSGSSGYDCLSWSGSFCRRVAARPGAPDQGLPEIGDPVQDFTEAQLETHIEASRFYAVLDLTHMHT